MTLAASGSLTRPIGIFLVDDHGVVRMGSRSLIDLHDDMEVVGEAGTAQECLDRLETHPADVVILDVRLPDMSGVALCREIHARHHDTRVVMLTAFADDAALVDSFAAGASAFVLKNVRGDDLIAAIRSAHAGERFVDPETAQRIGSDPGETGGSVLARLSPQERRAAHHLAMGKTNREIAEEMGLAEKTVKNYVSNLLSKLGMNRRSEAAARIAYAEATLHRPSCAESWDELRSALGGVDDLEATGRPAELQ